ncbi:ATP synthase F0F1 subunit alpha [Mycoplasmopsis californica]|uniref:ATP synthase subunit alpha n=1 Tax=Mycoplasmopsis equigenitalium TaxID=114883 RepID=A0ABY5J2R5_9BACT|nr:F0F1 ATP synthase subunit alpha [Mycoplasmopsis equigenitalium]UUD37290.1 F0F1 ATP synthase subunit alpha [Mycoplasmopsis equigenitalium]VEU69400.1 ATP synthase F0F1 subunit alpha [Mycoplasmopsis californica]
MAISSSDISAIIKDKVRNFKSRIDYNEVGKIITIGDGIANVSGINNVKNGEIIILGEDTYGLALNLEEDVVGVAILGNDQKLIVGDPVKRTYKVASTFVGDEMLGRVVNALGIAIDGKDKLKTKKSREIFAPAPSVMTRKSVDQPLETGILAIDSMIPIGKGQRELIIGDRETGKTAIAIDTVINQKGKNVNCIYVAIGQKNSTVARIVKKLKNTDALAYTTIVVAGASELAPMQYIAPYTGTAIAEEWMSKGKDVLIIYDDLSKHAVAYRTLSLLLRRPPGREAYPGDVFYLHSQLLERSARVNEKNGNGSITALPIVETQQGDISAYIPTNVISITDGQIFTRENLFNAGQRPAVDVGFSVSRIGSSAQTSLIKKMSGSLKLALAQYNEMLSFSHFGSDLDASTKNILDTGSKIYNILKQKQYSPINQTVQAILLLAIRDKVINPIPLSEITNFKLAIIDHFSKNSNGLKITKSLEQAGAWTEDNKTIVLKELLKIKDQIIAQVPNYDPVLYQKLPDHLLTLERQNG